VLASEYSQFQDMEQVRKLRILTRQVSCEFLVQRTLVTWMNRCY